MTSPLFTDDKPDLYHIKEHDLTDPERLDCLFRSAILLKITSRSEHDRLQFFALAAHATRVGKNPAKLFASNLYNRRWYNITNQDEQTARKMLLK